MSKMQFKTVSKTIMADTVTPVGLYLRFRDAYANTLLLESSDYHSKEDSFSFIAIAPIATIKAEDNVLNFYKNGVKLDSQPIDKNFNTLFEGYTNNIVLDCPEHLKSF
jgi:Anthranilate/para-aminobenzoate synthases component I